MALCGQPETRRKLGIPPSMIRDLAKNEALIGMGEGFAMMQGENKKPAAKRIADRANQCEA